MARYVVTVQFPDSTWEPQAYGPFATRIQAKAWIDRYVARVPAHYHVTLLEEVD